MVNTTVVPPGWAVHHQPVADGFMADRMAIERPTGYTLDAQHSKVTTWTSVATDVPGLVSIQSEQRQAAAKVTGLDVDTIPYVAVMPAATAVKVGDRITVTASHDALQVGRRFTVTVVPTWTWPIDRHVVVDPA